MRQTKKKPIFDRRRSDRGIQTYSIEFEFQSIFPLHPSKQSLKVRLPLKTTSYKQGCWRSYKHQQPTFETRKILNYPSQFPLIYYCFPRTTDSDPNTVDWSKSRNNERGFMNATQVSNGFGQRKFYLKQFSNNHVLLLLTRTKDIINQKR